MNWWENRKHIFAREIARLSEARPGNNFRFFIKDEQLWLAGTIPLPLDEGGQVDFEFELRYPKNYPFSVPYVYPKGREKDWVGNHQFISSGFCLDVREKTWTSSMSAVDIVESLERLLMAALDLVLAKTDRLEVYEQEEPTRLDRVRRTIRCVVPFPFETGSAASGEFKFHQRLDWNDARLLVTPEIELNVEALKNEYFILWFFQVWSSKKGIWIKATLDQLESIVFKTEENACGKFLSEKGLLNADSFAKWSEPKDESRYLLFFVDGNAVLLAHRDSKSNKIEYFGCYNQDFSKIYSRLPSAAEGQHNEEKRVAIIGCGSGGSSVAEELVKAGVAKLVLIDDEYLTVENVSRHACDLHDVGIKKIYALRNKLRRINPKVDVECVDSRIEVIENEVAEKLESCQLVINAAATAEEIINEFCWIKGIPSIHPKVYPLGFGGEIIRILPKVTPCFECMRHSLSDILKEQPGFNDFPSMEIKNYNETKEGESIPTPSLSVDAKFISLLVTKMAIGVLRATDMQSVPGSNIILWGNDRRWIFGQEFECLKVDTSTFTSYSNCVVCFGDAHVEKELGLDYEAIKKLITSVTIDNG